LQLRNRIFEPISPFCPKFPLFALNAKTLQSPISSGLQGVQVMQEKDGLIASLQI